MEHRQHSQGSPKGDPDALLLNMKLSEPSAGFADRLMERLKEEGSMQREIVPHFQTEWRNGLIAAAATVAFVVSDIPARIVSMDPDQVGLFIQINVLQAVDFGLQFIRFS